MIQGYLFRVLHQDLKEKKKLYKLRTMSNKWRNGKILNNSRDQMGKNYVVILKIQGLVQGLKMNLIALIYSRVCKRVENVQSSNLRRGYKIS